MSKHPHANSENYLWPMKTSNNIKESSIYYILLPISWKHLAQTKVDNKMDRKYPHTYGCKINSSRMLLPGLRCPKEQQDTHVPWGMRRQPTLVEKSAPRTLWLWSSLTNSPKCSGRRRAWSGKANDLFCAIYRIDLHTRRKNEYSSLYVIYFVICVLVSHGIN